MKEWECIERVKLSNFHITNICYKTEDNRINFNLLTVTANENRNKKTGKRPFHRHRRRHSSLLVIRPVKWFIWVSLRLFLLLLHSFFHRTFFSLVFVCFVTNKYPVRYVTLQTYNSIRLCRRRSTFQLKLAYYFRWSRDGTDNSLCGGSDIED